MFKKRCRETRSPTSITRPREGEAASISSSETRDSASYQLTSLTALVAWIVSQCVFRSIVFSRNLPKREPRYASPNKVSLSKFKAPLAARGIQIEGCPASDEALTVTFRGVAKEK